MKLAITGKGGVGKTTISAGLLLALARDNKKVIAIDADPDANLASTLEFKNPESIKPIVDMKELVKERAGEKGGLYTLNPKVDDIPDKYGVDHRGIKLLVMGRIKKAGTGCYCPENSLLKALLTHLILGRDETLIMDMEAGIEHLGRGTTGGVDAMLIVVEPGMRSIETAFRIKKLAAELKIKRIFVVANKVHDEEDRKMIKKNIEGLDVLDFIEYNNGLIDSISEDKLDIFSNIINKLQELLHREVSNGSER